MTLWQTLASQPKRLRGYGMPCGHVGAFSEDNWIPGRWRR